MTHVRRASALLIAVAVVGTACGSGGKTSESTSPTGGAQTTSAVSESTAAPSGGAGTFGDLVELCGPGTAKGATDQGVTDTEIVVGTLSDPGNTIVPGLNQELFDAADAFVGWCNDAGGILGRKIVLNKRDGKLAEAATQVVEACQTDFMLVGNGSGFDDGTVKPRTECGLPQIAAFTVSAAAGRAENSIMPLVNSDYQSHLTGLFRRVVATDPDAAKSFGILNNSLPSVVVQGSRNAQAAVDAGMTQVYYEETPVLVDNWRTYAENIKKAKVQVLAIENTPENTAALLAALGDVGYFPKYLVLETNHYNDKFVQEAAANLDQSTVLIDNSLVPFELAGPDFPATQQLIDLLKRYADAEPKALAVNAFSAWLLWAQAAKDCGSELTRACVMERASSVAGWTGGGLHTRATPANAAGSNTECFLAMQATSKGFVVNADFTNANEGLFNCDPANAVPVTGYAA